MFIPNQGPHMYPTVTNTTPSNTQATNIKEQKCCTQPLGMEPRDWGELSYTCYNFNGLATNIGWGVGDGNLKSVISSVI